MRHKMEKTKPQSRATTKHPVWGVRRDREAIRIEKAALVAFLDAGIENTTVEQIAVAAGISRRTFYRYFDSPEDVLTAHSRRSLRRTGLLFHERPLEEPPLTAYLAALHTIRHTQEEVEISRLAKAVRNRSPAAWARVMASIQHEITEIYESLFAARLLATGGNPRSAGILAAVLSAITLQTIRECKREGSALTADKMEQSFRRLVEAVGTWAPAKTDDAQKKKVAAIRQKRGK